MEINVFWSIKYEVFANMLRSYFFANNLNLQFWGGSYVKLDSNWRCDYPICHITRLYYVYKGSALLFCNDETITMEPGNLYMIPGNLDLRYRCPDHLEKLFFHVSYATLEGTDILASIPHICQVPCSQETLDQLKALYTSTDYYELMEFKSLVTKTIIDCLQGIELPSLSAKSYSPEVMQAISYMQNNVSVQLSGEQIAQAVFASPKRLFKRFKEETGITLGAYLDKLIFTRATQLLADPQLSIGDISRQLGFCDQFYFSNRFKALSGQTPTQYRKSIFPKL